MAEYQPEEIGTSENGARGSRTAITPLQKAISGRYIGDRKAVPST